MNGPKFQGKSKKIYEIARWVLSVNTLHTWNFPGQLRRWINGHHKSFVLRGTVCFCFQNCVPISCGWRLLLYSLIFSVHFNAMILYVTWISKLSKIILTHVNQASFEGARNTQWMLIFRIGFSRRRNISRNGCSSPNYIAFWTWNFTNDYNWGNQNYFYMTAKWSVCLVS